MARTIILSIVPAGARKGKHFAFQLQQDDRRNSIEATALAITIDNQTLEITNALTAYKKWGRISHPEIHRWIIKNRLHQTPPRNPAKLIFTFSKVRKKHLVKLYSYQANLIK